MRWACVWHMSEKSSEVGAVLMVCTTLARQRKPLYVYINDNKCIAHPIKPKDRPYVVVVPYDSVDVIRQRLNMLARWD